MFNIKYSYDTINVLKLLARQQNRSVASIIGSAICLLVVYIGFKSKGYSLQFVNKNTGEVQSYEHRKNRSVI